MTTQQITPVQKRSSPKRGLLANSATSPSEKRPRPSKKITKKAITTQAPAGGKTKTRKKSHLSGKPAPLKGLTQVLSPALTVQGALVPVQGSARQPLPPHMFTLVQFLRALRLYHRHQVVNLAAVPDQGSVLLAANHSLATYDIVLLMTAIYERTDRISRPLVDRLFFRIPFAGEVVRAFGALEGSPENAAKLLKNGEIITVAPGGMREALKPSSEKYQIKWEGRYGFIKLAMKTKTPIVLAACPKADNIYNVAPSALTDWAYKRFRVPVFLAKGFGSTPLPKPVKLRHHLSDPFKPPPTSRNQTIYERRIREFHAELTSAMEELMRKGSE